MTWSPTRSPSKGATAYHDAVAHTSWHKKNINELIKMTKPFLRPNAHIVDFGAGTGSSAIYFAKHLPVGAQLLLVDNSPSWLTKAYELLNTNPQIAFFLSGKKEKGYTTLDEILGENSVDHVFSANTVHLIPDIQKTFSGIYRALKKNGILTFQSGNIQLETKANGRLLIDDSINSVHDLAIEIIRTDKIFNKYKRDLEKRIKQEEQQRKFVFPSPRPINFYLEALQSVGFKDTKVSRKKIKVMYKDWLNFLRVRRLQAGILPEIGGKDASVTEEQERDLVITQAAKQLFKNLRDQNPLANATSFTAEWVYVQTKK